MREWKRRAPPSHLVAPFRSFDHLWRWGRHLEDHHDDITTRCSMVLEYLPVLPSGVIKHGSLENSPFTDDFLIETSIYIHLRGISHCHVWVPKCAKLYSNATKKKRPNLSQTIHRASMISMSIWWDYVWSLETTAAKVKTRKQWRISAKTWRCAA